MADGEREAVSEAIQRLERVAYPVFDADPDRAAWRQYAAAALAGLISDASSISWNERAEIPIAAARYADDMLVLERSRFGGSDDGNASR